jgi:hypothetical protein
VKHATFRNFNDTGGDVVVLWKPAFDAGMHIANRLEYLDSIMEATPIRCTLETMEHVGLPLSLLLVRLSANLAKSSPRSSITGQTPQREDVRLGRDPVGPGHVSIAFGCRIHLSPLPV